MSTVVRQATLPADREPLIKALREHLNPKTDNARFHWLYEGNPHGKAVIWVVVNKDDGAIVGSSAALPRYFYINGGQRLGCVFADSWIHPSFRYLGPAVTLQRSCLNAVCHGGFAAGYDFPQRSMIAVYRRLRIPVADELVTFERIVRLDRMLQNRIRPRPLGTILAAVGNPLLALAGRPRRRSAELVIEAGPVACSQEFDELAVRTAGSFGIHVARTAEYLNWRFLNHFHNRYEMVVARRNRRLAGYLVLLDDPSNDQLNIMDCLTEPEPPVWIELLAGAVQLCRERQRSVLAISLLSKDSRAAELRASRFVARRTLPCILHMSPEISGSRLQGSVGSAGFTYGDEAD